MLGMKSVFVRYGYGKIDKSIKPDIQISEITEIKKFFLNFYSLCKKKINFV